MNTVSCIAQSDVSARHPHPSSSSGEKRYNRSSYFILKYSSQKNTMPNYSKLINMMLFYIKISTDKYLGHLGSKASGGGRGGGVLYGQSNIMQWVLILLLTLQVY